MARQAQTTEPGRPCREGTHGWNGLGSPSPEPGRGEQRNALTYACAVS
jgi:hypothetical protein